VLFIYEEIFLLRLTLQLFIVINLLVLYYSNSVGIASVAKVAILPFQMNADEDIDYINRGIRDMLTSRITYGTHITILDQRLVKDALYKVGTGKLTQKMVQEVGSTIGVDYVIFGSITKIGNSLSIDISVLSVLQGGVTRPVFTQGIGLNEVIPKMSGLTQGIIDAISTGFGSIVPETTTIQPPEVDKTLLEEESKDGEVVPESIKEIDSTESDGELEVPKSHSDGVPREMKKERESSDKQSAESEGLKGKFMKRKCEIDSLNENPVYQKSINDLDKSPKAKSEAISQ